MTIESVYDLSIEVHLLKKKHNIEEFYDNINKLEKTVMDVTVIQHKSDFFRPFLLIGLGLIVLNILLDFSILRSFS